MSSNKAIKNIVTYNLFDSKSYIQKQDFALNKP